MISRRQKMVNLWKQVRFIEIVDPGNQFVKNLMFDGVYSSDFALLSEDILDWFSPSMSGMPLYIPIPSIIGL